MLELVTHPDSHLLLTWEVFFVRVADLSLYGLTPPLSGAHSPLTSDSDEIFSLPSDSDEVVGASGSDDEPLL